MLQGDIDQLNKELSQLRLQFEQIFDNIDVAIWSLEPTSNDLTVSAGYKKLFGYSQEEFNRNPNLWKDMIYDEDTELVNQQINRLNAGQSETIEHRLVLQSGEIRWVQCIGTPVLDRANKVVRINGVLLDITSRKTMEVALHASEQRYKSLFEYNSELICEVDLNGTIVSMNQSAESITGHHAPSSWMELFGTHSRQRVTEYFENTRQGLAQNYEISTCHTNGTVFHWDIKQVPIYINNEIMGLFAICKNITSQKTTEKALAASESMYRLIAENTTDMVRIIDKMEKTVYASPSHQRLVGYTPEQYIKQQIFKKMVHLDDREIVNREFNKMIETNQPRSAEFRVFHANGQLIYLEEYATPVMGNNNDIEYIVIVSRDITQKKRTEQALEESEAKYRLIAENMSDLIGVLDTNGIVQYASKRGLGLDSERMIGTSGFDYVHAEDRAYVQHEFAEIIRTQTNKLLQYRLIDADGQTTHVDCMCTPVIGDDGQVENLVVVSRDINQKVQMEKELKESEERYRRLTELSPQPIATHRDGKFVYINPAGVRLIGAADSNEIIGKDVYDIVHPDYMEVAVERAQLLKEEKYEGSLEYKLIRLDGQVIEAVVTGFYDTHTQAALIVFDDITERKQMERDLRESEERYRRLVELSPAAISIIKDNQFTYVNPAGMHTLGAVHLEDIIGTSPLNWIHQDDRDHAGELLESTVLTGFYSSRELKMIRLDTEVVDVAIASIHDFQSSTILLQFQDITARKQAEQALLESEELNRCLVELSPGGVIIHEDYKYKYVNPAGLSLLGASSLNDMLGESIFDHIHTDDKEQVALRLNKVYKLPTTSPVVEQKIARFDGTILDVEVIATSFPFKGQNAGLTLIRDITERKKAEDERKQAEQIVRESEERYYLLQTSLDRFSHDLFSVMKVSEVERRLIKEVREVTGAVKVSILAVDSGNNVVVTNGDELISSKLLKDITELNPKDLPLSEIIEMADVYLVKIGEIRGKDYLLCVDKATSFLTIAARRVWLQTITRYVSVLYDNFWIIEDLTEELEQLASHQIAPSWLLRLLFSLSENERKRLSQDLHDAALQEQIIWYRILDQISSDRSVPEQFREQLQQVTQGLLDVIYQIRITCNELRPPLLKEEGIVFSLQALFDLTQMRTNFCVHFDAAEFHHTLTDDLLLGIYRIVQELLANAAKHSNATRVHVKLSSPPGQILLIYEDNGIGMDLSRMEDSFSVMGVYGIKERVRSMDGRIDFQSTPNNGLAVFITIPVS